MGSGGSLPLARARHCVVGTCCSSAAPDGGHGTIPNEGGQRVLGCTSEASRWSKGQRRLPGRSASVQEVGSVAKSCRWSFSSSTSISGISASPRADSAARSVGCEVVESQKVSRAAVLFVEYV